MDRLARLACAFAPSYQNFRPHELDSAHIMDVDADHIEISAVLCEHDTGCVQVPVEVQFPLSCGGTTTMENMEECVLENLEILDAQAQRLISSQEEEQRNDFHSEELEDQQRITEALQDEPSILPNWWSYQHHSDVELLEECSSIKDLLNQIEFEPKLVALVQQHIQFDGKGSAANSIVVQAASTASVGPSGLVLRGMFVDQEDDDTMVEWRRFATVEVPIPFVEEATCRDDLRDAVLGLLASFDNDDRGSSSP
jgi:hypothetical protein